MRLEPPYHSRLLAITITAKGALSKEVAPLEKKDLLVRGHPSVLGGGSPVPGLGKWRSLTMFQKSIATLFQWGWEDGCLGSHAERRKGEIHINTKKTSKSFSGLSRLSVLRLSEVLAEEAVVHLLWPVGSSQGLAWAVFPCLGGNTPVWWIEHPCSREQPSTGSTCSPGSEAWAEMGAGGQGISISPRGSSHSLAPALSSQCQVRPPAWASITAGVRGRKSSPAWRHRWCGRVAQSNRFTSVGWCWDLGQQLSGEKNPQHLKLT